MVCGGGVVVCGLSGGILSAQLPRWKASKLDSYYGMESKRRAEWRGAEEGDGDFLGTWRGDGLPSGEESSLGQAWRA